MPDNLKIPYGVADFKRLRRERYYYVDKTGYIPLLERAGSFLFLVRPRRFGKSLMASMLRYYYDIAETDNFDELFGGLDIATNPTENRNRYQVLYMDFSKIGGDAGQSLQERFEKYVGDRLDAFMKTYGGAYEADIVSSVANDTAAGKFTKIAAAAERLGHHLYLMLDEYDNFTNAMIQAEGNNSYRDITHGQGFYRAWFKMFKGSFDRIYMTGVSPVTMDDLTSGFNIAMNVSQDADFNAMLGFSEEECLKLYTDFRGVGRYRDGEPAEWIAAIKPWYDGYCFSSRKRGKESVFNSDMVLYFLDTLVKTGEAPENMEQNQLRQEFDQLKNCEHNLKKIYSPSLMSVKSVLQKVLFDGEIHIPVLERFDFEAIDNQKVFFSLFFYYGILTLGRYHQGLHYYGFPNELSRLHAKLIVGADERGLRTEQITDAAM